MGYRFPFISNVITPSSTEEQKHDWINKNSSEKRGKINILGTFKTIDWLSKQTFRAVETTKDTIKLSPLSKVVFGVVSC